MSWCGAPRYLTWTPPTPQICGFGGSVLCFIIQAAFGCWGVPAKPHHEAPFGSITFSSHSAPPVPPAPCPQVFYWTHLSYISIWTLLIFHGPRFWKWFAVPGCLFTLEKLVGLAWRRAGGLRIVEVNLLPSKVCAPALHPPGALLSSENQESQNSGAAVPRNTLNICKALEENPFASIGAGSSAQGKRKDGGTGRG